MLAAHDAVLLDMDGTLVDTEPIHCAVHQEILRGFGIHLGDDRIYENCGKGDEGFYREIFAEYGIPGGDPEAIAREILDRLAAHYRREPVPLRPGASTFLDGCARRGIPVVVVTSTDGWLADTALRSAGVADRLPDRVCHEDTEAHKPDPAPYLLACRRLGIAPARGLAIEDSPNGLRSAKAAGASAVAVGSVIPRARQLAEKPDGWVARLDDLLGPEGT